jgi:hypothetical protein
MKKLFSILSVCCASAAWGASYVDTTVPGTFTAPVIVPGGYDITIQIVVADAVGTTATQASLSVVGGAALGSSSGRGGGAFWWDSVDDVTSVVLTAADGSQPITFTPTTITQPYGRHRSYTSWAASGALPVGTYTMEVIGNLTCVNYRGPTATCQRPPAVNVGALTTSTPLPLTYWWTAAVDPQYQALGVSPNQFVAATYPGDTSGPQQVCDSYDGQVQIALQAFFDSTVAPGAYQISSVTSTTDGTTCTYTYNYLDTTTGNLVSASTPSGVVTVATGAKAPVFPPPDD